MAYFVSFFKICIKYKITVNRYTVIKKYNQMKYTVYFISLLNTSEKQTEQY